MYFVRLVCPSQAHGSVLNTPLTGFIGGGDKECDVAYSLPRSNRATEVNPMDRTRSYAPGAAHLHDAIIPMTHF